MEAARATWTDSRLDDLNERVKGMDKKMDAGFARLDNRIDGTNERIDGTNERIDKLNHTMLQGMVALISIIAVLLTAFLTIVVIHL
jgi:peptidoglycan hydrolase CwlO-like protein